MVFSVRGRLGSILPLARNIGVLIGYTVGATVRYEYRPYIFIVFPVIYLISVYTLPNTPQYYLQRENVEVFRTSILTSILSKYSYEIAESRKSAQILQRM